jgi:hypothetical protein
LIYNRQIAANPDALYKWRRALKVGDDVEVKFYGGLPPRRAIITSTSAAGYRSDKGDTDFKYGIHGKRYSISAICFFNTNNNKYL